MEIAYSAKTDPGLVRTHNEDSFCIKPSNNLLLLCDGMGGHKAGELASMLAIETVVRLFNKIENEQIVRIARDVDEYIDEPFLNVLKKIIALIRLANKRINLAAHQDTSKSGMGTTIVLAHFYMNYLFIGHIGDSRCYLYRENSLKQITSDHSLANELLCRGEITHEEASKSEYNSYITRALGTKDTEKIDIQMLPIQENDLVLVCSDGLSDVLNDTEIEAILKSNIPNLNHVCETLISKANACGGPDNITIALAQIRNCPFIQQTLKPIASTILEENKRIQKEEEKYIKMFFK